MQKDDVIYRQQAIDAVQGIGRLATLPDNDAVVRMSAVEYVLFNLPPAQPELIYCKDCEHWKDSDGVYRRGIGAESKCPLNSQQVYEGTFFCGLAERKNNG